MSSSAYQEHAARAAGDPDAYWLEQARRIRWHRAPTRGHEAATQGGQQWFADGELNTAWLALDAQVDAGRGEQTALIHDSPASGRQQRFTYAELTERVARFAGGLRELGLAPGDRVVIYMPMVPEAVIAMLACARLGAIHSVVFGGFAPHELAVRIDDARPKLVLSASCGIEFDRIIEHKPLLDAALDEAVHKPAATVILQREQAEASMHPGRDHDWRAVEASASPVDAVPVPGNHPLYILYTSGTTGKPKGIVRDHGGHAVAMHYSMEVVYGMQPGEVFWAASDVGWVVGHSYIVYAPLIYGCTTVLYEGKPVRTPDAGAFWRVIAEHGVTAMFTAPTAFRAIRKEDPDCALMRSYDLSGLKRLFLAGERLDPATHDWLKEKTGLPVLDHWWQTETGWAIACNPVGLESVEETVGAAGKATPGFQVEILDPDGETCGPGVQGAVCIRQPLPPGCLLGLWRDAERFASSYGAAYPGYYLSGDGGYIDEAGQIFIMGRMDDVINVAGHRLSTGELEEIVASHPAVAECAVFGVADELKGQLPLGLVVLKDGATQSAEEVSTELVARVRAMVGAVACFRRVEVVPRLPKTRSGKILRRTLRALANGENPEVPSTIDDPAILDEIRAAL
ncbi:AMP-binding protein [Wenzhouxiangella marina]|uniref:Propionyl-CoA synthetase n=1 Tax=Wenzhouxiangella marina TaxID=1579979 RepID=A0A0K0XUE4_9GAMM|nr:AMP-binding protein [Wenzhouxiangella marina]AKS41242.1 propionyl-CoA synthetase [Wenzhouxiangella marina]MBB6088122.1 propionyl-CoA synthetase [Wenzhouxiangella marina]